MRLIIFMIFPFAPRPLESFDCNHLYKFSLEQCVSYEDAGTRSFPRDARCVSIGDAKPNCSLNMDGWGDCHSLQRLIINSSTEVPVKLFKKCPNLKRIDFEGTDYSCKNETWKQFITEAKRKRVLLCSQSSTCKNKTDQNAVPDQNAVLKGNFLNQIVYEDTKNNCPLLCLCKNYEVYTVLVDCSQRSLNDSDLSFILPFWSTQLYFDSNNLKDIQAWLDHIMRKYKFIERINLGSNQIQALPVVPETTGDILYLSFENNSITKFERAPFESYSKSKNFLVALKDNKWRCDCQMEEFVKFLMEKANVFVYQVDIYNLYCKSDEGESFRPWMYDFAECHKENMILKVFLYIVTYLDIFILSGTNLALIVLYVNLCYVLRKNPADDEIESVPWMHYVAVVLEEYLLVHLRKAWLWLRNLLIQRLS